MSSLQPPKHITFRVAPGAVVLSWLGNPRAISYQILRSVVSGAEMPYGVATATSFSDSNAVQSGGPYFYKIIAVYPEGNSQPSNEVAVRLPLRAPSNLDAVAGFGQVSLDWMTVNGATSFNVYRGTVSGSETLLANTPIPSYIDVPLQLGTSYYYRVTAVSATDESPSSNEVLAVLPPAVPLNLVATATIPGIALVWDATPTAINYNVYRSTTSGNEVLLTSGVQSGYVDTSVAANTLYYYKISAVNAFGEGHLSTEASATSAPAAPTNIILTDDTDTFSITYQFLLRWTAAPAALSYNIYRGTASGEETLLISGVTGTSYTDASGISDGPKYYYKISSVNNISEGPPSVEIVGSLFHDTGHSSHTYSAIGPDNNMWSVQPNAGYVFKTNLADAVITSYGLPPHIDFRGICLGPDNNLWVTDNALSANLLQITTSGTISASYTLPSQPGSLCAGPDGNLWVLGLTNKALYKVRPSDGFLLATYNNVSPSTGGKVLASSDGGLWVVAGSSASKVTTGGNITNYSVGTLTPDAACLAADGSLWNVDGIRTYRKTTNAGVTTNLVDSYNGIQALKSLCLGPDGNIWGAAEVTYNNINILVRYTRVTADNVIAGRITPRAGGTLLITAPDGKIWSNGGKQGNFYPTLVKMSPVKKPTLSVSDVSFGQFNGQVNLLWNQQNGIFFIVGKGTSPDPSSSFFLPAILQRSLTDNSSGTLSYYYVVVVDFETGFIAPPELYSNIAVGGSFSSSGSITPLGTNTIAAHAWGKGGDGGTNIPTSGGGGGGGGAFAGNPALPVTSGNTYTLTIDSVSSRITGDSSQSVVAVVGHDASGQTHGQGGQASACTGVVKFSGGDGFDGDLDTGDGGAGGGGGSSGGIAGNGNNSTGTNGGGGGFPPASGGGAGGDGASAGGFRGGQPASSGSNPGGGGGGDSSDGSGSATGANGLIFISFVLP